MKTSEELEGKPNLIWRLGLLAILISISLVDNNPLVRLEAVLGLSPSPIERFFGVKSLFSGMTEGVHQLTSLNFRASIEANVFAPLVVLFVVISVLTWTFPKLDTRAKETTFFGLFVLMSLIVNWVH